MGPEGAGEHDRLGPRERAAYEVVFDHLSASDPVAASDAIACFGSHDPMVPRRAGELYHQQVAPVVLTSGGNPFEPDERGRCEADVFGDLLEELGVPADRIVREVRSRHTTENVQLGLAALAAWGAPRGQPPIRSLVSVTWPFGTRRTRATLARQAPELRVAAISAYHLPGEARRPFTVRTVRAAVRQCDRLVRYRDQGLLVLDGPPPEVLAANEVLRAGLDRLAVPID